METLLQGFQSSLTSVSSEISTMQDTSQTMGIKLGNRQKVQKSLNEVLEGVVVGQDLVMCVGFSIDSSFRTINSTILTCRKICEGEVNEFYVAHLAELDKKMDFVSSVQGRNIRAFKDVIPELEKLRLKAIDKLRDFLLNQVRALRNPLTNISMIQQNVLLRLRDAYLFVRDRHLECAMEVTNAYLNTVAVYYSNAFEKYCRSLLKLQQDTSGRLDLLGIEENAKKGTPRQAHISFN